MVDSEPAWALSKYSTFSSTLESRISLRARELADGVKSG